MLQRVFEVLVPIIHPIAANVGDLIVCAQYSDGRAFLSVHKGDRDLQRESVVPENRATGLLFAALNDDAIIEIDCVFRPLSLMPSELQVSPDPSLQRREQGS